MPAIVSGLNRYQRQICVVLLLLTVALRVPLLGVPFERDEGEYAYIGWRLDHHELPYRDWVDQKPPAIFWVYRFAFQLPLDPIRAVHLMAMLFAAVSACALFFLALRFMEQGWAALAAILFVLLSADPLLYGTEANTEMFMLLPLILSVLAFFSGASNRRHEIGFAILSGAFIGIAATFKQVAAVQWPFLILMYPLFAEGSKPLSRMISFAISSAAGITAVWGMICLYFSLHHALNDFIYNVFTHNLEYVQGVPGSQRLDYLGGTLKSVARDEWPIWLFSTIGLAWSLRSGRLKEFLFLLAWLVVSMAGVSASGYYFPHYFQQLLPVLCLAAALGANALDRLAVWKTISAPLRRTLLAAIIIVPVMMVFWPFLFSYSNAQAVDNVYPGSHFAEKQALAKRLAQITQPSDRVFIFGAEPEVLFYAQRVSATRYIFLFPLYGPYSDAKAKQMAVVDEITRNAPAAVLYLPNQLFFTPGSEQYFTQWSQNYISQNFQIDSCLAIDPAGEVELITDIPHQKSSAIEGLKVFGALDVRKNPIPAK